MPTAGVVDEFALPTPDRATHGINLGPDGALWRHWRSAHSPA
ncbi:hypothetical protein [Streptomyces sp. NPDC059861]